MSSIGMVSKRMPSVSALLYLTTGSPRPKPVSKPFTKANGTNRTAYVVTAFPNQSTLRINLKTKQIIDVLIKTTPVYSLFEKIIPSISRYRESIQQKIFSILLFHDIS